ncbi:helix-turn-helix domain-containing protein [Heyndrickxia acidicola]|uniref:Helix-turn-helix transcriptional regulator n=1 Tax=Heyndrickxia acidicola TaxID=209389 RepID=A0ABU6ME29_9BACI|nr:helix-turn-helix transcriptional regulator [Heyndrickxia acidicola]MED1202559.1 helix-turn-helix transcriptional regulator [Heyndrickxia acidicola]
MVSRTKSNPRYKAVPRMHEIRKEKGIETSKELAQLANVTEPTISRFDSQTRYDINVLASVAKALNVKIDDLFIIEENKEADSN